MSAVQFLHDFLLRQQTGSLGTRVGVFISLFLFWVFSFLRGFGKLAFIIEAFSVPLLLSLFKSGY